MCSPPKIIEPMTSKVQPTADYWTVDRENLGTRLRYIWWAEKQTAWWRNSFKKEETFWMNNVLSTSASVDNTLLDLQNSSYPTRRHSIAKYWLTWIFSTQWRQSLHLQEFYFIATLNICHIDPFHKWLPMINSFVIIKISLTNLVFELNFILAAIYEKGL